MKDWKIRLARWMQGRYGLDELYKALFAAYFTCVVLSMLSGQPILFYVGTALAVFSFYRVFSKQLARRSAENQRYLAFRKKLLLMVNRVKNYKTHRYRSCPSCHGVLKLEKKIGVLTVNCPLCHNSFQVTIRR